MEGGGKSIQKLQTSSCEISTRLHVIHNRINIINNVTYES